MKRNRFVIWDRENKNIDISLKWSILVKAKPYLPGSSNCMPCLTEMYQILFS